MEESLYTLSDVMKLLKVTKITLYRYIKSGKLKAYKIGKEFRVSQNDLDDFLSKTKFIPVK